MASETMKEYPKFITHDSDGVHLWQAGGGGGGGGNDDQMIQKTTIINSGQQEQKLINVLTSKDCKYLAVIFEKSIKIYSHEQIINNNNNNKPYFQYNEMQDIRHLHFSPKSTFILLYGSSGMNPEKNLKIFNLSNGGSLVKEWTDKKRELVQWNSDESLAYRMVGSEILFYEQMDLEKCSYKFTKEKLMKYAVVTNKSTGCNYVAIFIKGQKGQPSTISVHSYPHLENAIVSKSFYKVDSLDIKWNTRGDAMLVLASTDYDTSGKSYYGETMLHFLDLRGETQTITGSKDGTVFAAEWLENNDGFLVIQGKMPAMVTWYNNRAEPLHSFGEHKVNEIHISPFSNLVAFTGFGNLSTGNVFIWNMNTKQLISHFQAKDTTIFKWLMDGQHVISGTHYHRLKVANGFKIWNYLGTMIHQEDCQDDSKLQLFTIYPFDLHGKFQQPQIGANVKGKILSEEPVQRYVPPSLRNKTATLSVPPPPPPARKIVNKYGDKGENNANNKKKKKNNNNNQDQNNQDNNGPKQQQQQQKDPKVARAKRLKNLFKKLKEIEQLKKCLEDANNGGGADGTKELEKNQLKKIEREAEILKEIEELKSQQSD